MYRRLLPIAAAAGLLMISPGCRICSDCGDGDYPAYGGAWQRTVRETGRVGSIFDPAGGRIANLTDRDDPVEIDQRQRTDDRTSFGDDFEDEQKRRLERTPSPGPQRQRGDGDSEFQFDRDDDDDVPSLKDLEGTGDREMENLKLDDLEI